MKKYVCMNIFKKSSTDVSEMAFIKIVDPKNFVCVTGTRTR